MSKVSRGNDVLTWLRTRARWIDRFAPVPSLLWFLPFFLLIAWEWLVALQAGFWIDECGAYWLAHHLPKFSQPSFDFKDLNVGYAYILSLFTWGEPPWMEVIARLPSLLAAIFCAAVLYSLSERVNGRGTGWIAAFLYAILPTTLNFATEARPYALGQLTFAVALWTLHAWFARNKNRMLAAHLSCMVLLVYLHPFFALAWPLGWIFVMLVHPDFRLRYTLAMVTATTLLAPLGYMLTHLAVRVSTIAYASASRRLLATDLLQDRVGPALCGVLLLVFVLGGRRPSLNRWLLHRPIIIGWSIIWLAWPLMLFAMARITGSTFYVSRYLALSAVGFALMAAGLLQLWRPSVRQAAIAVAILLNFAPGDHRRMVHQGQDLRRLAEWLQDDNGGGKAAWIAPSQLIEGTLPDASPAAEQLEKWTFAHISTYPVANPVFPMPGSFPAFSRPSLERQLDGPWRMEPRIVAGPSLEPPPAWFIEVLNRRGYRMRSLVYLFEFRR